MHDSLADTIAKLRAQLERQRALEDQCLAQMAREEAAIARLLRKVDTPVGASTQIAEPRTLFLV